MRTLLLAIILASAAGQAVADSSACYSIQDADARAYCRAKAMGDSSVCYAIQNSGMRSMCLAEVRK